MATELKAAAKEHAKAQLGEQFAKNKDAARAIQEDFTAGAEWMAIQKDEKIVRLKKLLKECYNFVDYHENGELNAGWTAPEVMLPQIKAEILSE